MAVAVIYLISYYKQLTDRLFCNPWENSPGIFIALNALDFLLYV